MRDVSQTPSSLNWVTNKLKWERDPWWWEVTMDTLLIPLSTPISTMTMKAPVLMSVDTNNSLLRKENSMKAQIDRQLALTIGKAQLTTTHMPLLRSMWPSRKSLITWMSRSHQGLVPSLNSSSQGGESKRIMGWQMMTWMIEKTGLPLKTTATTGRPRLHRIKRKTWSRSMIELPETKAKWSTHRHRSSRKRWSCNAHLILFWESLSTSQREKLFKMSIRIMWGRVWSRVEKGVLQSVRPSTWKS